jgi:hypothetical protein
MNIVLDKMKELEEEAHVQASRYLQWKQTHILEDMQWEQAEMMAKMEEAVTTKMKLMEDMMSEEMRMIKDVLIDHKTTAHASGSSEKGGDTAGGALQLISAMHEPQYFREDT